MLVVGLTGGVGAGKTTVARRFAEHGVPVLDADEIARGLVEPGSETLAEVVRTFGREVLRPDQSLDRARLRRLVFGDPAQRRRLEAILHPRVRNVLQQRSRSLESVYCILCVPLLIEAHMTDLVDRVLVVDAPEAVQAQRVLRRGGVTRRDVEGIVAAQVSRAERLAAADDVIVNDADLSGLYRQVDELHAFYMRLANGAGDRC